VGVRLTRFKSQTALGNGKPLVYLDNTATSQRPVQVIDAIAEFYKKYNANIHRALHTLSNVATELYENAHMKVQKFINAKDWREIIFTRNTTESINLVSHSLSYTLKPGDEIVTTISEHHSNILPWQMLRDHFGIVLKYARINQDGSLDLNHLSELTTEKTRVVAVNQVSNVLGLINPVKEIVRIAHEKGSLVLIDAAQSAPHIRLDVQDIDADFLAFSGHKMLGPTGIGVLYGKKELLDSMEPFLRGGDMIRKVTLENALWNELPWKFEAGTSNFADGYAFGAAIDYLSEVGLDWIEEHEKEIVNFLIPKLLEIDGIHILGTRYEDKIGVISFFFDDISPETIGFLLNEDGIAVRTGCHCAQPLHEFYGIRGTARASFYLYNTVEEAEFFVDRLSSIVRKVRS